MVRWAWLNPFLTHTIYMIGLISLKNMVYWISKLFETEGILISYFCLPWYSMFYLYDPKIDLVKMYSVIESLQSVSLSLTNSVLGYYVNVWMGKSRMLNSVMRHFVTFGVPPSRLTGLLGGVNVSTSGSRQCTWSGPAATPWETVMARQPRHDKR